VTTFRSISLFIGLAFLAFSQDPRGTITGILTDASQATIPDVEIRATNVETGVTAVSRTNASGNYTLPFLLPGIYRISAEAPGFKRFARDGVQVRVSGTVTLPIQLELGTVAETLDVKADTPLLDFAGASLGQVVDHRRITELPIAAGNPLQLMLLAPGIVEPSTFSWRAAWNFRQITSDGNGVTNNEFQVDGVSNTFADSSSGQSRYAFAPPQSSVEGFKVETSPYDASIGHTIGALINVITKGGTNQLHGDAHWFVRNRAFDAPSFFNNRAGVRPPVYQDNRYGFALGGPVLLPKVYNGKNKTFWFYAYDANKWTLPQPFTGTVPTAAQRQGDFSALLAVSSQNQIYDPATTVAAPNGRLMRQPFAGNIIPTNRLDPIALNLLNFYPLPNQPGTNDGRNNFFNGAAKAREDYFVHIARVDHSFSDQHRAYLRLNYDWWEEDKNHYFNNNAQGLILNRINRGLALDDVYVISPSLILNVRYGLTQQEFPERRASRGFDLSSIGFSSQLTSLIDRNLMTLPRVAISGYSGMGNWESGDGGNSSLTHSLAGNFTKVKGSHSVKFGADFRVYRSFGNRFPLTTAPDLNFGTEYTRGPFDNSAPAAIGQQLASMLLGLPGGSMARTASFAMQDKYLGLFIHDDFKVTRRLTLNLGLRYEYEWPLTERFDRLAAGFASDTANPIEAQAIANYARNPIPELPVSQFRVRGGQFWVNQHGAGRSPFRSSKNDFLPRIGLAFMLTEKTTLRAGYGVYYDSMGVNTTPANQTGFSQSTPIQASLDTGLTFIASTSNPFPNGLLAPLGPAGGLTTNLGQSLSFYSPDRTRPYAQRWSFGLQRLLPGRFVLDASYVGNKGIRLPISQSVSNTDRRYLSTLATRDQERINFLTAQFPNPFSGLNTVYGTQTNRASLLTEFPQFSSVTRTLAPLGYSWYHALQVQVERRYAQSFTFQLSYTWSKAMEAVQFLNASDPLPYRSIGTFDRPHRISMSGIWDVPFGKGRRYGANGPKPLQFIAGGWQLNGLILRQAGPPLGFGNAIFNGDLKDIPLDKEDRSVEQWFNVNAGFNRNPAQQLQFNLRTFPLLFSGVRGDGRATWDFSAIKSFAIRESVDLQFRAECYNSFNHPNFGGPDTNPASSAFGTVSGTASDPRNWQFSLKLKF
jgi:hypothetical protein